MTTADNMETYDVIVVGGGQAGLSASYYLKQHQIKHLVLDRHGPAHSWRNERWDNFCLVTPNWQCQLPGFHYQGDDADGFMVKDEIIKYLEEYIRWLEPPLLNYVSVTSIEKLGDTFKVITSKADYYAKQVIIACGSYHYPRIPAISENISRSVLQMHSVDYKNASSLPDGGVLIVGSGQSGCQIAEDLFLEGRETHLAVGDAPRVSRRYRGKDVVNWLDEMGYYKTTIETHDEGMDARLKTNHYVTGRDGGRDLNLRIFAQQGMKLYGQLASTHGNNISFADDLIAHLDMADEVAYRIDNDIEKYIVAQGIDAPSDTNVKSSYVPPTRPSINLHEEGISSIIWATGFGMDFSWIHCPVFDERGVPVHQRGVTSQAGLYFLGLNWQYTWGSGRFYHVGNDAEYLIGRLLESGSHDEQIHQEIDCIV